MMKRATLYSRRLNSTLKRTEADLVQPPEKQPDTAKKRFSAKKRQFRDRLGFLVVGVLIGVVTLLLGDHFRQSPRELTQEHIDSAVLHTLATKELPSRAARAAAVIAPSVVRIRTDILSSLGGTQISDNDLGVGTGIVIKEDGTILTNLHVVANAPRLVVTFADGMHSPAVIVSAQKDKDLATLKPLNIPDDLKPATLGSSKGSYVGDEVVVIGFPYGYGPSVSSGVISGFNREYKPTESTTLKGLIQFDAAANPGNSGGPLVNMAGEVLGIVTAILNPTDAKTFAGIGFAVTIESAGDALGIPPF
ncbi:trypsin-like peptidase domain-containing protein [Zwartia sp.]|uniref:S1C family serine protease n=1 Tax=Zwartia sp. TaxID=2978004 RepID=UPI00271E3731|nr:trypsin-like peptidase domain-containing protein [Zwartia sp.]MDO9023645.1 trypsin-like peptidase domain-containing protein [Zwartia sp.]